MLSVKTVVIQFVFSAMIVCCSNREVTTPSQEMIWNKTPSKTTYWLLYYSSELLN